MGLNLLHWNNKIAMSFMAIGLLLAGCGGVDAPTFTVSGKVSGLVSGETVVLQNSRTNVLSNALNVDVLSLTATGASDVAFTFSTAQMRLTTYTVTVSTQPAGGKTCTVANGTGTISIANVTGVTVICGYTVGGSLSGLGTGKTVVLQNNIEDPLTINANASSGVTFASALLNGSPYSVTVRTQPAGQTCRVSNGSGTVSGVNVTNVATNCYDSGTLDNSFDTDGIVVHNNAAGGSGDDYGTSITTTASGVLVTGNSVNSSDNTDMVIWGYNSSGVLDTSFGSGGIVVHAASTVATFVEPL